MFRLALKLLLVLLLAELLLAGRRPFGRPNKRPPSIELRPPNKRPNWNSPPSSPHRPSNSSPSRPSNASCQGQSQRCHHGSSRNETGRNDTARIAHQWCHGGKGEIYKIGLKGQPSKISVCFRKYPALTYWTKHYLYSRTICNDISKSSYWKTDGYDFDPSTFYRQNGLYERGHLTPKCDFYSPAEQAMTFYYINSAPQYRVLNRGNWRVLERSLRTNVTIKQPVKIITGTVGSLETFDRRLIIPKYFFKVVVKAGEVTNVFVGFNSPGSTQQNLCDVVLPDCNWSTIICCEWTENLRQQLGLEPRDLY